MFENLVGLNIDYALFFCALSFFLLGAVAWRLSSLDKGELQWRTLAFSGFLQSVALLADMLAVTFGVSPLVGIGGGQTDAWSLSLQIISLLASTVSFAVMLEFGLLSLGFKNGGLVVTVPLVVLTCFGAISFMPGLFAASRFCLGMTGGLAAALAIMLESLRSDPTRASGGRMAGVAAAAFLAAHAILTGFVLPDQVNLFIGQRTFNDFAKIPFQLLDGFLIFSVAVLVWVRFQAVSRKIPGVGICLFGMLVAMPALLAAGWVATWMIGESKQSEMIANLVSRAKIAAVAIDERDVAELEGSEADARLPAYFRIKKTIVKIRPIEQDCRFVYLMKLKKDGSVVFLADAEPEDSKDFSPPGQVYPNPGKNLTDCFSGEIKTPLMDGPDADEWGVWVSAIIPILDPKTNETLAILGMDIDAKDWNTMIHKNRLEMIVLVLVLALLLTVFLFSLQKSMQDSRKASDSLAWRNAVFQNSSAGIIAVKMDGTVIDANSRISDMFGTDFSKPGFRFERIFPSPDRFEVFRASAMGILKTKGTFESEVRLMRGDGVDFWCQISGRVIDQSDMSRGIIWILLDISERRKAEAALRESEKRWLFAIEGSGDGVWDWDIKEAKVFYSKLWKRTLGFDADEVGSGFNEFEDRIVRADHDRVIESLRRHLKGETEEFAEEFQMTCRDSSLKWVLYRGKVTIKSESGENLRMVGTLGDISHRKKAEEQLHKTLEDLARFNKLAVGREKRILELKAKVNFLLERLGEPPTYKMPGE